MSNSGENRAVETRTGGGDPKYARMILGKPAVPPRKPPTSVGRSATGGGVEQVSSIDRKPSGRSAAQTLTKFLLPQPETSDRFALFQLVAADLAILFVSCLVPLLFSPAWTLPADAMVVYAVLVTLFGFSEGLYRAPKQISFAAPMSALTKSVLFATVVVFIGARDDTPLPAFPAAFVASLVGLAAWRCVQAFSWKHRPKNVESRNVLIVGANSAGRAIARALRADPLRQTTVRGFLDDRLPLSPEVLGRIEDLDWLSRSEFVDEVILAAPQQPAQARAAAEVAYRNHLDIRAVPDLPSGFWPDAGVERIGGIPVVDLHREPLPSASLFLKRLLDIAGAILGLTLATPLMAIVALLIRIDSPGPIFYSAERSGAKGHPFRCHKFRTMSVGADQTKNRLRGRNQRQGPIFKLADDPRTTHIGRFLRRYSLDELPQLWNVLRGEMSLVGPRPHPVEEVHRYELHHYRRLDVKPGITGLWQVTARQNPSFELNMHLDLTYIENWTLLLDLRILLSTVRALFVPEGA